MTEENEDFSKSISDAFAGQEINTDDDFEAAVEETQESEESTEENTEEAPSGESSTTEASTEESTSSQEGDSSLSEEDNTSEETTADSAVETEITAESSTTKSFEELLAERTGGKYSKWEELEEALNSPKDEFVDDEVRRINELKKSGVNLDRTWFEMQTRDYENMEEPAEILAEAMRLEDPSLTDSEIEWELKTKYRIDEWPEDGLDEEDIDPKQKEIEKVFSAKMLREASKKRDELIEKRDSTSWKVPKNPEAEAKAIADAKAAQEAWEKSVENVNSNFSKLTNKVSEKDAFDYILSDSEKSEVSSMMKQMGENANVFWNQFVNEEGKIDQSKVYETIVKSRNYDNAVTAAYQKGMAVGQEAEVKDIKNINFKPDSRSTHTEPSTFETAVLESLLGKKSN